MSVSRLADRFRGALLGTFAGDALGMPIEGWSHQEIRHRVGSERGEVRQMMDARLGPGTYTDDTQMTLALAEAVLDSPPDGLDLDYVAFRFAEAYREERGYGSNTRQVLVGLCDAIRDGNDWREVVSYRSVPGGAWTNGAAMRVAPVSLGFYCRPVEAARAAEEQATVTGHTHPIGRAGARLQALSVLASLRRGAHNQPVEPTDFLEEINVTLPAEYSNALGWISTNLAASPEAAATVLGVSGRASESVPAALWAFLSRWADPEEVIVRAVGLGGDTDTIGAMAGALAGAYHGADALPTRWIALLEDGYRGRSYAEELGDRLCWRARADHTPDLIAEELISAPG